MPFASTNSINRARPTIITQVLKGLGQIMLQENAITGLLFLAGIFYSSATMGLAALDHIEGAIFLEDILSFPNYS